MEKQEEIKVLELKRFQASLTKIAIKEYIARHVRDNMTDEEVLALGKELINQSINIRAIDARMGVINNG